MFGVFFGENKSNPPWLQPPKERVFVGFSSWQHRTPGGRASTPQYARRQEDGTLRCRMHPRDSQGSLQRVEKRHGALSSSHDAPLNSQLHTVYPSGGLPGSRLVRRHREDTRDRYTGETGRRAGSDTAAPTAAAAGQGRGSCEGEE